MMHRDRNLTMLAEGLPCMFKVPSVCNHNNETTVWCHSNEGRHGKGAGIKAHDIFGALGCSDCHRYYDFGTFDREFKHLVFIGAMERTMLYLWTEGLVGVKDRSGAVLEPAAHIKRGTSFRKGPAKISRTAKPSKQISREDARR